MTTTRGEMASPRLRRLLRTPPRPAPPALERCELCAAPLVSEHRHLLDVRERRLLCSCRPCALLFDREGAGGGYYRAIPEACRFVSDFSLDEESWNALRVPVEMAFFFYSTPARRVVAFYPSPAGPVESLLDLDVWERLEAANPVLRGMEADVEALLVNRLRGARQHWVAPVDACYRLVGVVRAHWQGFGGGDEVRRRIDGFFEMLRERSTMVRRDGSPLGHER